MSLYSPVGLLRKNEQTCSEDEFIAINRALNPTVVQQLDGLAFAGRLARETHIPYILHREYESSHDSPALLMPRDSWDEATVERYARLKYAQWAQQLDAQAGTRDIHIQVFCEQGHPPHAFLFCRKLMALSVADGDEGLSFVFINTSIGGFGHGYWVDAADGYRYHHTYNDYATPAALAYLLDMDAYRQVRNKRGGYRFIHGQHDDYHDGYPNAHINAGRHAGMGWERAWLDRNDIQVDWRLPQDYMLRTIQAQYNALRWRPSPDGTRWEPTADTPRSSSGWPVSPPWQICTEAGIDDTGLIRRLHNNLQMTAPWSPQGWNTYWETWARWFPGMSPEQVYAEQENWDWKVAHGPTELVIGLILFAVGNTSSKVPGQGFTSHNLLGREPLSVTRVWNITRYLRQAEIPEHFVMHRIVDVNPGVEDLRWKALPVQARHPDGANVRLSPALSSQPPIGVIPAETGIAHFILLDHMTPAERARAVQGDKTWVLVMLEETQHIGWVRRDVIRVGDEVEVSIPADPPAPPEHGIPLDQIRELAHLAARYSQDEWRQIAALAETLAAVATQFSRIVTL